ncbi:Kef-type K+ transport system, membrane component KefB [Amycolatopsis xylanica]|uniref:Kef-type K+ transport system, membrane component KefB n=1 Tax=Amycolatopsis xylanica TaxID=589385 RepID=A0A1H3GP71_9PSEU|nr:cation:proton antiporter [Amycolatopsis xylanica]SDY05123.1 Kef-type K+ transport system, membrane component KefB [Amycolatopsis xylanica]
MSELAILLAALAVLLGLARVFGAVAAKLGQPAVVGEIACGLVIGAAGWRVPSHVGATLDALAQFGLILFLFGAGAGLAPSVRSVKAALVPALGATVLPFALGAALALWLAQRHAPAGHAVFVLFVAAAMAVTAFPVLARILAERGMLGDADGRRALSAAAITDALAWTVLAFVAGSLRGSRVWTLALIVPVLVGLYWLSKPWFGALVSRLSRPATITLMIAVACLGAAATDAIGLHAALGAFLAGVAVGPSAAIAEPVGSVLVPLFFVLIGRKVELGGITPLLAAETAVIIAIAVLGKSGGAYLGARAAGEPRRAAAVFATLMNTRGVTELVFLSIGLDLGVIDSGCYAAMVVMALVTTAMTGPLLNRLLLRDKVR